MVKVICKQCGKEFFTHNCQIKRGGGKFCSISCGTTYRNLTNNPTKSEEVRRKISQNHADVSGKKNPMYGRTGELSPTYIDGRSKCSAFTIHGKLMEINKIEKRCVICGSTEKIEVHHKDGNHQNNAQSNLVYLCHSCHRNIAHTYLRDSKGRFCGVKTNDIDNNIKE